MFLSWWLRGGCQIRGPFGYLSKEGAMPFVDKSALVGSIICLFVASRFFSSFRGYPFCGVLKGNQDMVGSREKKPFA